MPGHGMDGARRVAIGRRAFLAGAASLGAAAAIIPEISLLLNSGAAAPAFVFAPEAVPVGAVWGGMAFNDFSGYVPAYSPPPAVPGPQALAARDASPDFWSQYYAHV